MNDLFLRKRDAAQLIVLMQERGPFWKTGSDIYHLSKRQRRGHIPKDFTVADMNNLIIEICTSLENKVYVYHKEGFEQNYFVFSDNVYWIAIVGENGIMETVFPPDSYESYLAPEFGYTYLGTIREVLHHG